LQSQKISTSLVFGAEHAGAASELLNEAWNPPAIHYTAAYMAWQRTFPAPWQLPAAIALDCETLVGFAGTTARRLQHGSQVEWAIIVSFVAVKPHRQRLGIAGALYDTLLDALRKLHAPVVTFAIPGSAGERTLRRAYARSGFQIRPFGTYASHMAMAPETAELANWESFVGDPGELLPRIAEYCAADETLAWNAPDHAEITHYVMDPHKRAFVALRRRGQDWCGGAFLVETELRSAQGVHVIPTIESVFLRREDAVALPLLFNKARTWGKPSSTGMIAAPNLVAFDEATLQKARIRRVGAGFQGYACGLSSPLGNALATTVEIV
jgi:GNAT superfamily N-acetyltransferase